jgi:AraC-like DNA-binding protein
LGKARLIVWSPRVAQPCLITSHRISVIQISGLAVKLGISQRYLQRLLEATGKTFTEHVEELRLDRAFSLLSTIGADKRVSDIAFAVGYSDLTNFYRHFRSRFGDTPKGIARSAPTDKSKGR